MFEGIWVVGSGVWGLEFRVWEFRVFTILAYIYIERERQRGLKRCKYTLIDSHYIFIPDEVIRV